MSVIYDIRNLKTPVDLERKRSDFFKTLRLQAKLNRDYEDSMIARQQIDKLGLAPMLDVPLNAEAERTEVMLQYDIAVKHLRTLMNEQQALNALGRFTDEEVFQLNSQWSNIEPLLMDKRNIMTGQFLVMFFRRYMDNLEREGQIGTEIPLLETTIQQLPQDVRQLWQTFAKGYVDSQTGQPWSLDTLISITANSLSRSIQDVENEVQNRMLSLTRHAPARIAATAYFEKPAKKTKTKTERSTEEKMIGMTTPIIGTNASETFSTPMQVEEANAENARAAKRGRSDEGVPYADKRGRFVGTKRKAPGVVGQAEALNNAQQAKRQRLTGPTLRANTQPVVPPTPSPSPTGPIRGMKRGQPDYRSIFEREGPAEKKARASLPDTPGVRGMKRGQPDYRSAFEKEGPAEKKARMTPLLGKRQGSTVEESMPSKYVKSGMTIPQAQNMERARIAIDAEKRASQILANARPTTARRPRLSPADHEGFVEEYVPAVLPGQRLAEARQSETERIRQAIQSRTQQLGQGRILHPRPGRNVKLGKGLPENQRGIRYAQFGKYVIHLPSLDKQTISIKYPSILSIADIPNKHVSLKFVELIRHYLATDILDKGMFNGLDQEEQEFFYYLARRCSLDTGMSGGGMTDREKKEMERFELVRGQVIAGNNAPELLKELKQYLLKFLAEKRITRAIGNQILYEIAMLS